MMDSDAVSDDAADTLADEPETVVPDESCTDICSFLWDCMWHEFTPSLCGGMCARFRPEGRDCILEALASGDCRNLEACEVRPPPPDCKRTCDFIVWTCGYYGLAVCYPSCPLYKGAPRWCAELAVDIGDCWGAAECMMKHEYGHTCDQACNLAAGGCGMDVDVDECIASCSALPSDGASASCIDTAVNWEDCEALGSCGGLVP